MSVDVYKQYIWHAINANNCHICSMSKLKLNSKYSAQYFYI